MQVSTNTIEGQMTYLHTKKNKKQLNGKVKTIYPLAYKYPLEYNYKLTDLKHYQPGPSCSKLTMSLVNDSLKFTLSDTQIR